MLIFLMFGYPSRVDCGQSISFPSVFLAYLSRAIKQQAASGKAARSVFFSLICVISTEFRARGGFQEQKPTTRSLPVELLHQVCEKTRV